MYYKILVIWSLLDPVGAIGEISYFFECLRTAVSPELWMKCECVFFVQQLNFYFKLQKILDFFYYTSLKNNLFTAVKINILLYVKKNWVVDVRQRCYRLPWRSAIMKKTIKNKYWNLIKRLRLCWRRLKK